jgi:hypothetical protein
MEVVDNDRVNLRGIKVSVVVQEHMHGKQLTCTEPGMTMHNQTQAEDRIYRKVHRRRRCQCSTGDPKEGCGKMTLERSVGAPVAGWPGGRGTHISRHRGRSNRRERDLLKNPWGYQLRC